MAGTAKMRSSTSPLFSPWGRPGPCSFTVTPPLQNSLTPQHMQAARKHFLGIFGRERNFPLTGRIYCGIVDKHLRPMPVCRSGGIGRRPGLKILCSKRTCRFDPGLRHHTSYRGVEQLVARRAHNPEVGGSSPPPATRKSPCPVGIGDIFNFLAGFICSLFS